MNEVTHMADKRPRVVLLSLDSFRPEAIAPDLTPRLSALAASGGMAPDGGRCQLPSVTYPSHATLLTGRLPLNHGVRTGFAGKSKPGIVPGWAGETRVTGVPTLFDLCRSAGLRSAAICGDQNLWSILNAAVADVSWPPHGAPPEGVNRDVFGYATNAASHPHALAAVRDLSLDFVFAHYNEPDTLGHLYGPDAPETLACYTATDTLIGELIDVLRDDWDRLLLLVLSDHGIETLPDARVDLLSYAEIWDIACETIDEGGCSLLRLRADIDPGEAGTILVGIPGVARVHPGTANDLLVEAIPGVVFGPVSSSKHVVAGHGGATTCKTLAIVGGGHPAVVAIAKTIGERPPLLADWAPTIASVLGLEPKMTDGTALTP
jgi:arylsulfatase A-like enzyme